MYPRAMIVISRIVTEIFFSPLLFVLLIGAGVLLAALGRKHTGFCMLGATALLVLLLSMEPVCDGLILPLENEHPAISLEDIYKIDAIAVLGGGSLISAPDEGGASSLSAESLARLAHGIALFRRTGAPLIVSGGEVWGGIERESWAAIARRVLLRLGVQEEAILTETESRTTWENAVGVARISESRQFRRIALVTSAYHMPRSMLSFQKAGLECIPAPTDYRTNRSRYTLLSFLPSSAMLSSSFQALREYAGRLLYIVRSP